MHTLSFDIPEFPFKIDHSHKLLFLGSCFSDDISRKFKDTGFNVEANPLGTIFHPSVLARFLIETIDGLEEERIFQRDDVFLSWDAGAKIYGMAPKVISTELEAVRSAWKIGLKNTDCLFITFGSAFGYLNKEINLIAANCHKLPSAQFTKILSTEADLLSQWEIVINRLKSINPKLKIVFTVSPVRHVKDGLIENNRSKAILIRIVEELIKHEQCFYFPSYEIVIDELRDYRYFKEDMVHPNEMAIQYVWERLSNVFFGIETNLIAKSYLAIKRAEDHIALHPESQESKIFQEQLRNRKKEFLEKNPQLIF